MRLPTAGSAGSLILNPSRELTGKATAIQPQARVPLGSPVELSGKRKTLQNGLLYTAEVTEPGRAPHQGSCAGAASLAGAPEARASGRAWALAWCCNGRCLVPCRRRVAYK